MATLRRGPSTCARVDGGLPSTACSDSCSGFRQPRIETKDRDRRQEHAGDPHYEPSGARHADSARRFPADDLWGGWTGKVYADSTWTAVLGDSPSAKQCEVFRS